MGVFNRAIPTLTTNRLNQVRVQPEEYYVDDIFDPLFNEHVREQLALKYGNPILGTFGGYVEGIDNALIGQKDQWGILGPGMGILSGFGRSMDKAGDFIIGGLTEGVKFATGQGFESPIRNIFVEDEDYSGARLLAAMGNSMAKLADAPTLNESDFKGLWNIPGTALELMTDPGILGGGLSRAASPKVNLAKQVGKQQVNQNLADVGQLLSDYDDIMARVSMDITAPGLRQGVTALYDKIQQLLGTSSNVAYANHVFNKKAPPKERFDAQDALRQNEQNKQYSAMSDEMAAIKKQIDTSSKPSPDLNSAQAVVATLTTVPNAVKEQIMQEQSSPLLYLPPNPNPGTYDEEVEKWLVDAKGLTESEANLVKRAMAVDLEELIAAEQSEIASNLKLEKAIRMTAERDLATKSAKASAFFEDPYVKEHVKITNPNLYADLPDEFTLDDLDIPERTEEAEAYFLRFLLDKGVPFDELNPEDYAAFRNFFKDGARVAREDLFNRIHEFAKQQHGFRDITPNIKHTLLDLKKKYDNGTLNSQLDALSPIQKEFLTNYFKNLNDPTSWESSVSEYYKKGFKQGLFSNVDSSEFEYTQPDLLHIPTTSAFTTYAEEDSMWESIFRALNLAPSIASNASENVLPEHFLIDARHLENVLPKALAEHAPEEAPELYSEYLHRLNYAYDMDNESARNSVLRGIGIDPQARKVRNIQKTPVTLSPSEFTGRSDASLKLQVQYAHKRLTEFVKKYPVEDFIENPELVRAFPNARVRNKIKTYLEDILNLNTRTELSKAGDTQFNVREYLAKVKELSDYIVDRYKPVENVDFSSELDAFKTLSGELDTDALTNTFDSEEMFYAIARKVLSDREIKLRPETFGLGNTDEVESLLTKMKILKSLGYSYDEVKDMVKVKDTLSYAKLKKSKNLKLLTPIRELGLTVKDFDDYDKVIRAVESFKDEAAKIFYENRTPTSDIIEDIMDLADGLQRNVVQAHEFRWGPVREHTPLPNKFWEQQDAYADEMDIWAENEVYAKIPSGKKGGSRPDKYLNSSANDVYTYNFHSVINNLIRVNPEAFATPEGRAVLQKYFGDSFQVKVHSDYGVLEGVSKDAIESYKTEVLPLIEDMLERGYSPYVEVSKKNIPPKVSSGYKYRALLGNVPNVKPSPYAHAYKIITNAILHHPDDIAFSNTASEDLPLDFVKFIRHQYEVSKTPVLSESSAALIRQELRNLGVKENHRDLVTAFLNKETLSPKEWRALNTAFQNLNLASKFEDIFIGQLGFPVETLTDANKRIADSFNDIVVFVRKKALQRGRAGLSVKEEMRRVLKNESPFFPTELSEAYFKSLQHRIPYFKNKRYANTSLDDVVDYFIDHPTEYGVVASFDVASVPLGDYAPSYLQYVRRFMHNAQPYKQIGWIDYSKLYGNEYPKLWETVVNKTEVQSPYKDPITFTLAESPKNAVEKAMTPLTHVEITAENVAQVEERVVANIVEASTDEAASLIADMPTPAQAIEQQVLDDLVPNHREISKLTSTPQGTSDGKNVSKDNFPDPARVVHGENYSLFKLVSNAMAAVSNSHSGDKATLRTPFVKQILDDAHLLMTKKHIYESDIAQYVRAQTYLNGAKVSKEEFLDTLASSGLLEFAFKPSEDYSTLYSALQHNAAIVNVGAKKSILKTFKHKLPNGNTAIGIMWDTSNRNIVRDLEKGLKNIDSKTFMDIVRLAPGEVSESVSKYLSSEKYGIIDDFFDRVHRAEGEYAKALGFKYDDTRHVKNVKVTSSEVADYLTEYVYKDIDIHTVDGISDQMLARPMFKHLRGSWGSRRFDKRLIGYVDDFEDVSVGPIFAQNAANIVKGALGEGSFNNSKFQLYIDLFENDNFRISKFINDVNELQDLFNAKLPDGRLSGNMQNLVLAAPRRDLSGRIIGFTQFDKTTRAGLTQAMKNPDTVLLPAHAFAPLDRVLRKDALMSNKVYAFINKHLTLPFKFGVLMNPGFILGNANDAYLKQATTMAHKYGTSVSEELANVAMSIRDVMQLNNAFDSAYRKFLTHIAAEGFSVAPTHYISELAANDPRVRKMLKEYVSGNLQKSKVSPKIDCRLSKDEILTVRTWMTLNSSSTAAAFNKGLQDMDVIAEAKNSSAYAPKANVVDRILTGNGEYVSTDVSTWGLFINNPLARKFMDVSENTENLVRAASILNDFRHKGLGTQYFIDYFNNIEDLKDVAKLSPDSIAFKEKIKQAFDVNLSEAINTMHHANFDYERVTDFTNAIGTFVPFPTFFLKNLGYWLEVLVEHPQYIDHAISIQEGLWRDREEDTKTDSFAAEAKGRGAVPMPADGQNLSNFFKGIFKPTPLQSMFGAFSLLNSPVEDMYYRLHPALAGTAVAATQLSPALQSIAAKAIPQEDIKYRPYSTDMYERNVTQEDPNFNPLSYAIHRLNPIERSMQAALRLPDKLRQDEAQLADFAPSIFQPDF